MAYDLIVIGAGAAGLLAAARAAERGFRTLLVEKNRKPGVKILMSGGTRCNLTHATNARGIVEAFGKQGKFLHSALAALGPADLVALFAAEGVATKREETGKIFPQSDRALDVLNALLARLRRSGATLHLDQPVLDVRTTVSTSGASKSLYQVVTATATLKTPRLLITTGGQSYPGCGTTGDAYSWLRELGHTIIAPRPALVPLVSPAEWLKALQGITLPDVAVKVVPKNTASAESGAAGSAKSKPLAARRGSFLITHFGISGPVALDVSREVSGYAEPHKLVLECDFLPHVKQAELEERFRAAAANSGKKQIVSLMPESLPRRVNETLLRQAGIEENRRAAELGKQQRTQLVQQLKANRVPLTGTRGFPKAEVTAGGASLEEVDSRTMQSKRRAGLYLAGEVLDLDGPIGGYNFQAAFSTGYLMAERLE